MLNRAAPYLLTLLSFVGLVIIQSRPQQLLLTGSILLVVVIALFYLVVGKNISYLNYWVMLVPPLWLIVSSVSLMVIAEAEIFRWAITIFTPLVIGFLYRQIYIYNFTPEQYQPYALENLSVSINIYVVFLSASSLFGFRLFLGLSWTMLLGIFALIIISLTYQTLWAHKLSHRQMIWWLLSSVALISQLFIAMGFLPVQYVVSGLIISIAFYLLIGLNRLVIRQSFRKRLVAQQVILSSVLTLVVLITARWI